MVGDEEPEGEEAAVVLPAVAVVAAGETLLHVQYESEVNSFQGQERNLILPLFSIRCWSV